MKPKVIEERKCIHCGILERVALGHTFSCYRNNNGPHDYMTVFIIKANPYLRKGGRKL